MPPPITYNNQQCSAPSMIKLTLAISLGLNFFFISNSIPPLHSQIPLAVAGPCSNSAKMDDNVYSLEEKITNSPSVVVQTSSPLSSSPPSTQSLMMKSPAVPLFMGRIAKSHPMPYFEIPALTLGYRINHTILVPANDSHDCAMRCRNSTRCNIWVFYKPNSSCALHDPLTEFRDWTVGLHSQTISGNAQRDFVVWTDPSCTLPRSNRTLFIVNWHWPTTGEKIMTQMIAQAASLPPDVDIVHAVPNAVSSCLHNVWTYWGYLSQLSLSLAHAALPGYRGYLLSNDDAFVVWNNMPLMFPFNSWHAGKPSSYSSQTLDETKKEGGYRWHFSVPENTKERSDLKLGSRNDQRALEALTALGVKNITRLWRTSGFCDVFYITQTDAAIASHWLKVMASYGVFLEIAVSNMFNYGLDSASIKPFVYLTQNANWKREYPWFYFDQRTAGSIHPAKLSNPEVRVWLIVRVNGFVFGEPFSPGYAVTGK